LGFVKINFHNKHAVYMHDTPLKSLFGSDFRMESSGCVRVADVDQLVAWMLRDTPGWDLGRVQQMKQTGQQLDVKLKTRIPVYFVYLTAWATPDGQAHFRHDMYRRHGIGVTASAL
jgi:murein L,D-transpeptidase YcbB/YkuD